MTEIINQTISTAARQRPDYPDYEIKNPMKNDSYPSNIAIVLDAYFVLYGALEIRMGNRMIYSSQDDGNFRNARSLTITLAGEILKRDEYLQFFIWNLDNDNEISLSAVGAIQDTLEAARTTATIIPADQLQINQEISSAADDGQSDQLFPFDIYYNQVLTELIDLQGARNMLVLAQAANHLEPEIISTDNTPLLPDLHFTYDSDNPLTPFTIRDLFGGDLKSSVDNWTREDNIGNRIPYSKNFDPVDREIIIDMKYQDRINRFSGTIPTNSITENSIRLNGGLTSAAGRLFTFEFFRNMRQFRYESSNNRDGTERTLIHDFEDEKPDSIEINARYLILTLRITPRILISITNYTTGGPYTDPYTRSITYNPTIEDLVNISVEDGTASLSFQVQAGSGEWQDFITTAEINAAFTGREELIEIGADYEPPFLLPSSQSRFRAVLTVIGGIQIGITVIRIS